MWGLQRILNSAQVFSEDVEHNARCKYMTSLTATWSLFKMVDFAREDDYDEQTIQIIKSKAKDNASYGCEELEAKMLWTNPAIVFHGNMSSHAGKTTKGWYSMFFPTPNRMDRFFGATDGE